MVDSKDLALDRACGLRTAHFPAISSAFQCDSVGDCRVHGRPIGQAAGVSKPPDGLKFAETLHCLLRGVSLLSGPWLEGKMGDLGSLEPWCFGIN